MPMGLHHSVACYIARGKDAADIHKLDKVYARCTPMWADTGKSRYDSVLVQEYEQSNNVLNGQKVGRLRLLLSIQDTERQDEAGRYMVYTGALIETFNVCNGGKIDAKTGLVKVQVKQASRSQKRRVLDGVRMYDISHVTRPIQLVPADLDTTDTFFINNYTDWDIYNMIYKDDFERRNKQQVDQFAATQA